MCIYERCFSMCFSWIILLICGYMGNLMGTHVEPPAILVCKKTCPFGMILSGGIPQSVQTVNFNNCV